MIPDIKFIFKTVKIMYKSYRSDVLPYKTDWFLDELKQAKV
jgi:hypothetical protein